MSHFQTEIVFRKTRNIAKEVSTVVKPVVAWMDALWRALSLRAKLTVLIGGLILVMTGFFYGFAVYQTTREIKLAAVSTGQAVGEALKDDVSYALQYDRTSFLNFTFRRVSSSRHNIAYVYLLDTNGKVLAHSEPEQVGRKFVDPMSRRALGSATSKVQFERRDLEGLGEFSELCDVSIPILVKAKRAATLRIGMSLTQSLLATAPRIRSRVALFAFPFAFLSILIALKLSDSFTRPLRRLAQAATEVSRGNYDVQLPLSRQDELGNVAQAFNTMAQHLKENFAKVSDMANRDGLTGLYNARYFHEALTRELERTRRTGRPLSLILFDADFFKRVNDRYGHPTGDLVLQHISKMAKSVFRGYDMLARYGGEEFIAMLTETNGSQALLLGERLRKTIEQSPLITEEGEVIKVTTSVGVASARAPYHKSEVISHADQALYRSKETGRNKVSLFKSATPETSTLNIA